MQNSALFFKIRLTVQLKTLVYHSPVFCPCPDKLIDNVFEEDLMDMRTPIHTTSFPSEVASKPASTTKKSTFTGPTQVPTSILDTSIEADEIGIGALRPTQPPSVVDKTLNQSLLQKLGGLANSKWAK